MLVLDTDQHRQYNHALDTISIEEFIQYIYRKEIILPSV